MTGIPDNGRGLSQALGVTLNLDIDPWERPRTDRKSLNPRGESCGITRLGVFPNGTSNGRATVMLEVRTPDGVTGIAEVSLRNFLAAAAAIAACPVAQLEDM